MANFMKKVKTPRPLKPVKPISEVKLEEKSKFEEEKVEEIKETKVEEKIEKIPEESESSITDETTEKVEEEIKEQTTEVLDEELEEESKPEESVDDKSESKDIPEEKPKTKKKSSRRKKKEESVESKENKEAVDLEKAEELMLDTIMPCAEGWAEEKKRVNGMLNKIVITEELDPTSVKSLIADMSSTLRELIILATESKVALANLKDIMEEVRIASSTGTNSEERKMNGMYAMKNYEHDESIIDLTVLLKFYRERQEFYEAAVKEIEINRQMLITFGSVFKLELAKAY